MARSSQDIASSAIPSWSKFPYGVRLPEDPSAMFQTLLEQEVYGTDMDVTDQGIRYKLDNQVEHTLPVKAYLQDWFRILRMNPKEAFDDLNAPEPNEEGQPWVEDGDMSKLSFYDMPNYTDTRVGGNDAINPYWQFNRDDDIVPNMLEIPGMGNKEEYGMGRLYSERYNDNQQILWLNMGVAEYTDLISFYMDTGDYSASVAMKRGTVAGLAGRLIKLAIKGVVWAFTFPIHAGMWFYKWIRRSDMSRITKYYWFNPSMTLYYEMVNSMLSYLAVGMGLYPTLIRRRMDSTKMLNEDMVEESTPEYSSMINGWGKNLDVTRFSTKESGIPELLQDGPDIFVIMNRRAKLFAANRASVTTRELLEATKSTADNKGNKIASASAAKYFTAEGGLYEHKQSVEVAKDEAKPETIWNKIGKLHKKAPYNFLSTLRETTFGAGDFVGFRVERSSNASESVSNETGMTSIAQTLNNIAERNRDEYENTMGGSPLLRIINSWSKTKDATESFVDFAKGYASRWGASALSTLGLGDIGAIITNGNGFLNIPEVWKNSSFSKNYSFSIELQSRYGDPVSIYQSIYIPMIMLLAASLPRSIGTSMYTSPFLIKAYCKGQFAIPCGIVSSLDITRGKEEHGWSNQMLPTSVSISLSLKDLTPAMFLGMGDIGIFDTFSRNEAMHDYLDTLSALGISERKYLFPQIIRKASAALLVKRNTIFSSTYYGSRLGRSGLARAYAYLTPFGNNETTDLKYNASMWRLNAGGVK